MIDNTKNTRQEPWLASIPRWVIILLAVVGLAGNALFFYNGSEQKNAEIAALKSQNEYVFFGRCTASIDKKNKLPAGMAKEICGSILKHAMAFNEDPFKVLAVMGVESNYRPSAISSSGAVGLMQIIPSAWAEKCGVEHYELWVPDRNIRCGVLALNEYKKYGKYQLISYNRGPGNVAADLQAGVEPENGYTHRVRRVYGEI